MTQKQEECIRYIRAKIMVASEKDLGIIAAFISGLGIAGWSTEEYDRTV